MTDENALTDENAPADEKALVDENALADEGVPPDEEAFADEERDVDELDEVRSPSKASRVYFGLARAVVVLAVGAIVYQLVIPFDRTVPARLSRLVVTTTGQSQFANVKSQSGIQDDTQTGLAAMNSAVKQAPNKTGLYSIEWSASQTSAAGVIAFLLPSPKEATALMAQIKAQQLSASAYSGQGLARHSAGAIPGIPGSSEAIFTPVSKKAGTSDLAVELFQHGRVVGVAEELIPGPAQTQAENLATKEYGNLARVEPGFTLTKVIRPTVATSIWAAGTVLLALIAALGPSLWRAAGRMRRRRLEERLSHQVVVGDQVIYKYRR